MYALVQANHKYEEFIHIIKNGKRVMYQQVLQAMYGCLKSARLFQNHLSVFLKRIGPKQNDYNLFLVNKTVNGKSCTIVWHVDDFKISHEDKEVVGDIIKKLKLEQEYGKMTVTTGDIHSYCGMVGRGSIFSTSCKQQLIARSLT